jgi:hypothetical protein
MTGCAVFAALSLLFPPLSPPLSYASGAVVGLATLKQGPREGALVIGGSLLLAGGFALVLTGTPAPAMAFLGMSWLPAWMLAMVLAGTRSQGAALLAATGLGVVAVLTMHAVVGDPAAWWREVMGEFFAPALQGDAGADMAEKLAAVLDVWAPRMTRYFGAATVLGLMLSLLLARWAHATLDNPGGFGKEFRALSAGRIALGVSLVVGVVAVFVGGPLGSVASDLMGPITAMLAFQGLAVAHAVARAREISSPWLVAMYLLLAVPPHLALPVLALTGLLDGWMDFRGRSRKS